MALRAFFEVTLVIANIGTADALFPISQAAKRRRGPWLYLRSCSGNPPSSSSASSASFRSYLRAETSRGGAGADGPSLVTAGKSRHAYRYSVRTWKLLVTDGSY
jgi:hypothetical protein